MAAQQGPAAACVAAAAAAAAPASGRPRPSATVTADALECTVCLSLYVEPTTLHCGHTFCRDCIAGSLARSSHCPLCRMAVDATRLPAESVALKQLVQQCFPVEYASVVAAKTAAKKEAAVQRDSAATAAAAGAPGINWAALPRGDGARLAALPIITGSRQLLWPYQPTRMMIVEPHYVTMVEAALRTDAKVFGVHASLALGEDRWGRTGLVPGTLGTLVAIADVEERPDSAGNMRYALSGQGVGRYQITGRVAVEVDCLVHARMAHNGRTDFVHRSREHPQSTAHGLCRADVVTVGDTAQTDEAAERAAQEVILRATARALSIWQAVHPEARRVLTHQFGDLSAPHTLEHPFRVSCWLASALRLDKVGAPSLTELLTNDVVQKRRLYTSRSTLDRTKACDEVLRQAVAFADDQSIDDSASNYAVDHPSELFAIGQQSPFVVRLMQHSPPLAALALLGIALACWAHLTLAEPGGATMGAVDNDVSGGAVNAL